MQIKKAIEISDAKIQFVSLVDKAANLRQFLITKAEDGTAKFSTYGKILKVDTETHYLTGIVYEPLVEDAHGNFMTEEEIQKAAYWFAKNGDQVDIQHSFEAADGIVIVENYIAPCDMVVGDTPVVKGTWLITVEVSDAEVWAAVEKGAITGFSMGGLGKYSEEDVDLSDVSKTAEINKQNDVAEKKGVFKKLAELFGLEVVEKGEVTDAYVENEKRGNFWGAFSALQDVLYQYNWETDTGTFESDEAAIRSALSEFSAIITDLLTDTGQSVAKALAVSAPVKKAGKKMSSVNQKKLDAAYQALADLREELIDAEDDASDGETVEKKEDIDMNEKKIQEMIDASIAKALGVQSDPAAEGDSSASESIQKMVDAAIAKALEAQVTDVAPQTEDIQKMVDEGVAKAIAPILQARGLPSNLNDAKQVEKADDVFTGLFV